MKRNAFTLVELMVVIAVVALLVAMITPSMTSVYALARSTICRGNLQRLSDAFASASSRQSIIKGHSGSLGGQVRSFPQPLTWPATPHNVVDDRTVFLCPEEEDLYKDKDGEVKGIGDLFKMLEYVCPYGRYPLNTLDGKSTFYISRTGADTQGAYTDFMFQDDYGNGQFELMNFHGWYDTDGFCRVYHNGTIWIPSRVPSTPDFSGAHGPGYPDRLNTCGDLNAVYYRGKPAFGSEGRLRNFRDQTIKLANWNPGFTNYGINSYVHQYPFGSKCVVIVDYKELVVEVDDQPDVTLTKLKDSARHLGKLNYLMANGAVQTAGATDINPQVHGELWNPRDYQLSQGQGQ